MADVGKILRDERGLLLAYDHGFEYGPAEFNDFSVDPKNILKLAEDAEFTGFICQKGVAAQYYDKKVNKIPLIVKLNGKTSFRHTDDPLSLQNCTVDEAVSFGADGVGYVIHIGSKHEQHMISEFGAIEREAHDKGLFVIAWMYVTGDEMSHPTEKHTLAYAARLGMELNSDALIVKYSGDVESFKWVVANAGRAKVFVVGGPRMDTTYQLLDTAKHIQRAGAAGFAIGRNIWQAKDPAHEAKQVARAIFGKEE